MVAFLLPVMLLMLMMIVNINQLVFTKIKLQNTVDACALSAAAVQAAGLNEIADLTGEMAYESAKAQWFLSSGTWHNFSFAVSARNFFYNSKSGVLDHIRRYQKEANAYFAAKA
ncbi:MAG: pilus assembly protein TadG-related protein, partial [Desulfobacterales bacterium]